MLGRGQEGVGEALEGGALLLAGRRAPEFVFVAFDGVGALAPRGGYDQGFADAAGEQGVALGQKVDLARGVPPGEDEGVLGRMLGDGDRQGGKLGEFVVDGQEQFAGVVFPVEQHGGARCRALRCG